jgi:hypothetical protein
MKALDTSACWVEQRKLSVYASGSLEWKPVFNYGKRSQERMMGPLLEKHTQTNQPAVHKGTTKDTRCRRSDETLGKSKEWRVMKERRVKGDTSIWTKE